MDDKKSRFIGQVMALPEPERKPQPKPQPQQDFLADEKDDVGLFYAKVHRYAFTVFAEENLSRSAIMAYLDLAYHCNARTGALHRRDVQQIADSARISRRRVFSALVELEKAGLVTRQQFTLGGRLPHIGLATARAQLANQRNEDNALGRRALDAEYQRQARVLDEAYGIDVSNMPRENVAKLIADLKLELRKKD